MHARHRRRSNHRADGVGLPSGAYELVDAEDDDADQYYEGEDHAQLPAKRRLVGSA
jgi:hypothetical protein